MLKNPRSTQLDVSTLALSANALVVLEDRYLARDEDGNVDETPADLFHRVAHAVARVRTKWGASREEVRQVEDDYYAMMTAGRFLPNSPTLRSAGRKSGMLSACFVLPLEDSIEDIMKTATDTAMVHKAGGGTGVDLSRLRPRGSKVSASGGTTEGPISFLRMLSGITSAIQQGGFRRGANMAVMRIDHPDILAFVDLKSDLTQFTNYNLSVAVTDDFVNTLLDTPDAPHIVVDPHLRRNGVLRKDIGQAVYTQCAHIGSYTVAELWERIATRAWETGEPGLVFIDEVNRHNATAHVGLMRATNPCGEQPLLDNEACNLGSINLATFYSPETGEIDMQALGQTVHLAVGFLDDVIDANNYPTEDIRSVCEANRRIGLGVMGFADLLFQCGIPYDSQEALEITEKLASFIRKTAWDASTTLAQVRGTFPNWGGSAWDTKYNRQMRNAAVTTIAPTGTISIIAGCSGGIEPAFSLAFIRRVLEGRTLRELNPVFLAVLSKHINTQAVIDRVWNHAFNHGTVQDCEDVPEELKKVFRTAKDVSPEWHVRMQAAWQKHTDSAVSKTINLPSEAAVQDVKRAYLLAYKFACKGITVYRDGSRRNQPMALTHVSEDVPRDGVRVDHPMSIPVSVKERALFSNIRGEVTVAPQFHIERQVFTQLVSAGDLASADSEAVSRLISMLLGLGVELRLIAEELQGIRSSLLTSPVEKAAIGFSDALARAVGKYLRTNDSHDIRGLLLSESKLDEIRGTGQRNDHVKGGLQLICPDCEGELILEAACVKCCTCGFSHC
jgi:ribonucleoside-diphosphate reductase alpha chain